MQQIELPAKLLDYSVRSDKSNINQKYVACVHLIVCGWACMHARTQRKCTHTYTQTPLLSLSAATKISVSHIKSSSSPIDSNRRVTDTPSSPCITPNMSKKTHINQITYNTILAYLSGPSVLRNVYATMFKCSVWYTLKSRRNGVCKTQKARRSQTHARTTHTHT